MAYYTRKPELVEAEKFTEGVESIDNIRKFVAPFKIEEGTIGNIHVLFLFDQDNNYRYIWPNYYIVKRDAPDSNLYTFSIVPDKEFKEKYQPDSCSLDGSGCE